MELSGYSTADLRFFRICKKQVTHDAAYSIIFFHFFHKIVYSGYHFTAIEGENRGEIDTFEYGK